MQYKAARRDLDIFHFDKRFWEKLSFMSQLPTENLRLLQLHKLEGIIQEKISPETRNKWIILTSGGTNLKTRSSSCFRFCPVCLKEGGYYPQNSKLLFMNICIKHKIYMVDRCQKCSSPILPILLLPPKNIRECFNCGHTLCGTGENAPLEELKCTTYLLEIMGNNHMSHQGHSRKTFEYFTVLYLIAKSIHKYYSHDAIDNHKNKDSPYILHQTPNYLSKIITISVNFLENEWDNDLLVFLKENRLVYASVIIGKRGQVTYKIPKWFFKQMIKARKA